MDVKKLIVYKCLGNRKKYTTEVIFPSGWYELRVNYFLIFLLGQFSIFREEGDSAAY